ncbi:MAG: transposase, partial [Selenomonadaceae bacterium]|nr:transposase [Selenomonadaceae bacterium]
MGKRKHSADWMLARVKEYLSSKGSYRLIAEANGISAQNLRVWVKKYRNQGAIAFVKRAGNASYSKEF